MQTNIFIVLFFVFLIVFYKIIIIFRIKYYACIIFFVKLLRFRSPDSSGILPMAALATGRYSVEPEIAPDYFRVIYA
jgi:hypothetical protein